MFRDPTPIMANQMNKTVEMALKLGLCRGLQEFGFQNHGFLSEVARIRVLVH